MASPLTNIQNFSSKAFSDYVSKNRGMLVNTFENLQKVICRTTALCMPNFDEQFHLEVDASNEAVGAVLYQRQIILAFFSKKLSQCEKNYSTLDKEYLALYLAIKRFNPYLYGVHFKAYTDHKPLVQFLKHQMHSPRQQRWFLRLQQYDYDLSYIKGSKISTADFLSRVDVVASTSRIENKNVSTEVIEAQKNCKIVQNCINYLVKDEELQCDNDIAVAIKKCAELNLKTFLLKTKFCSMTIKLLFLLLCKERL